jgi:hypothetical protein
MRITKKRLFQTRLSTCKQPNIRACMCLAWLRWARPMDTDQATHIRATKHALTCACRFCEWTESCCVDPSCIASLLWYYGSKARHRPTTTQELGTRFRLFKGKPQRIEWLHDGFVRLDLCVYEVVGTLGVSRWRRHTYPINHHIFFS